VRGLGLAAFALGGLVWGAQPEAFERELNVSIRMRDGVDLSANILRPAGNGRVPALLVRTPYNKGTNVSRFYEGFVRRGYAVVIEDVRGRFGSEGVFEPMHQETADAEDTLNWIARQSWSNRRIGMLGGSYLGIVQWKAALLKNPYLKAIFPAVSGCDDYFDRFYSRGGALKLAQRLEWMAQNLRPPAMRKPDFRIFTLNLPLRSSDRLATGRSWEFYQHALDHPSYDAYWKSVSVRERLDDVEIPVFAMGGWYDNFIEGDLEAFRVRRKLGRTHRLIVGPWAHNMSPEFPGYDFGPEARLPIQSYQAEWFDHWVKGEPERNGNGRHAVANPPLRIYVMGANRWRDEEEWPLSRARTTSFYLASRGHANTAAGDGRLERAAPRGGKTDRFVYDPRNPAPTAGGRVCCNPRVLPWGPVDQRAVEQRKDVLVYSTPPLAQEVEVTGPVEVTLWVATSQPDTDFTAKLVDAGPDGRAVNLTDGILRLRYRGGLEKPELAKPGQVYPITIDAGVTSNVFAKGHRIRLEISSSNFPKYDRNPNTGRAIADEKELRPAHQTVYHDRRRPSRVDLPIVPGERNGAAFAGTRSVLR
jgi:putative CocE/NonD family hydrolase